MKFQCLIVALLIAITGVASAHQQGFPAEGDVLVGGTQDLSDIVAQINVKGGKAHLYRTYELRNNGGLYKSELNLDKRAAQLILTLSPGALSHFKELASKLQETQRLVVLHPDAHVCTDTPSTSYSAKGPKGELVLLGAIRGCREYVPSNDSDEARALRNALQNMLGLSTLSKAPATPTPEEQIAEIRIVNGKSGIFTNYYLWNNGDFYGVRSSEVPNLKPAKDQVVTLSQEAVAHIVELEAKLPAVGALTPENPNENVCLDGSQTLYLAKGIGGIMRNVGADMSCIHMIPSQNTAEATELLRILKNLLGLSNL